MILTWIKARMNRVLESMLTLTLWSEDHADRITMQSTRQRVQISRTTAQCLRGARGYAGKHCPEPCWSGDPARQARRRYERQCKRTPRTCGYRGRPEVSGAPSDFRCWALFGHTETA